MEDIWFYLLQVLSLLDGGQKCCVTADFRRNRIPHVSTWIIFGPLGLEYPPKPPCKELQIVGYSVWGVVFLESLTHPPS